MLQYNPFPDKEVENVTMMIWQADNGGFYA